VTFDAKLRTTLQAIHAKPSAEEAGAIVDVVRLAAAADKKTDLAETVVMLSVSRIVCEMAGLDAIPVTPSAIDAKRLADIGDTLVPIGARELAYACAFLVMIQDLDLTAEEHTMAVVLGEALVIEPGRSKQLAAEMEALARSARA
jgi:hypothetical protein